MTAHAGVCVPKVRAGPKKSIEKFPIWYDIHKYLGRKPWYVIRDLIEEYSRAGDTVLDIFAGSGVASFEALRLDRKVIALDHSQLSELITKVLCNPCQPAEYEKAMLNVIKGLEALENIYKVKTRIGTGILQYWVPELHKGKLVIKGKIVEVENISDVDFPYNKDVRSFSWEHAKERIPKVYGSNIFTWDEVFSKRSQYVLYNALGLINRVNSIPVRMALLVAFSAAIEKISLLNHAKTGKRGWIRDKQTCYYKHLDFIEFNAIEALKNKFAKVSKALVDTTELLKGNQGGFEFVRKGAETIDYSDAVDLILMDPPYLEEVPYDKLEALHDIWLGFSPQIQNIGNSFNTISLHCNSALKKDGRLVLLMLNYEPESKKFFIDRLERNGFMKTYEKGSKGRVKEGLTIVVFKKSLKKEKISVHLNQ